MWCVNNFSIAASGRITAISSFAAWTDTQVHRTKGRWNCLSGTTALVKAWFRKCLERPGIHPPSSTMSTVTSARGLSDTFLETLQPERLDRFAKQLKPCVNLPFWKVFLIYNLSLFSSVKAYFLDAGKMPFTESLIHLWGKNSLPASCSLFVLNITAFPGLVSAYRAPLPFLLQALLQSVYLLW